jgi:hypothetical protein
MSNVHSVNTILEQVKGKDLLIQGEPKPIKGLAVFPGQVDPEFSIMLNKRLCKVFVHSLNSRGKHTVYSPCDYDIDQLKNYFQEAVTITTKPQEPTIKLRRRRRLKSN